MKPLKVSFLGLGYVGLTHAATFAHRGIEVVGYDPDTSKANSIREGKAPFYEPGLGEMLKEAVSKGVLRLAGSAEEAVGETDVTFITVGTPENPDGSLNLKYLEEASRSIGKALRRKGSPHLVVVKSTVPPGATRNVVGRIVEEVSGLRMGEGFYLAFSPEFLREGNAVEDVLHPDRVVVGELNKESGDMLMELYSQFYGSEMPPYLRTGIENAELIKLANNAFLAMKVSFINMLANLAERIEGGDIDEVAKGIGMDRRIGPLFLNAGPGWGGSCWPKDLGALLHHGRKVGVELPLVKATIEVNEKQPYRMIELAKKAIGELKGKRVTVLGLSFKPNTDDMRHAVSIKIVNQLLKEGADVTVYDPKAMDNARRIFGDAVKYANTLEESIEGSDCALLVTEWNEFRKLEPGMLVEKMRTPCLIDSRRIFKHTEFGGKVKYYAIGLWSPNRD